MFEKAIVNGRVWMDQSFIETNVYIDGEHIQSISKECYPAKETIDANKALVIPGLIDPHVHFHLDLGHIHSRDDFLSGSKQAAYGGMSAYIDFLDPVDNPQDLILAYEKRKAEVQASYVDYFFHATIKNPQCDLEVFVQTMLSLNIRSLKLFTTYSDSNRRTYDKDIIELLKLSEKYGFLLLAHIENDDLIHLDKDFTHKDLLKSRPSISEEKEALKLASYVKKYGGYLYMVHLSSGRTLEKLIQDYSDIINQKFFIESCPHYFTFTNECLDKEDGYLYTLAPPLRTRDERKRLRRHFKDVYTIGTDHCAFNKADKQNKPLVEMPLGIGGIEYSFDVMYGLFGQDVIQKMSTNIVSLYKKLSQYGKIKEGFFANMFIYQLKDMHIYEHHGHTDYTLYHKMKKNGELTHAFLRGHTIIKDRHIKEPIGKELTQ
jgi:dihydropyrimidinase